MLALSDSRVISDCSAATLSPALTRISMTLALPSEPMSGTKTSCTETAAAGAGGCVGAAAGCSSALGAGAAA
ncbi:hypothetical protein D9M73_214860 [compost metagenome]